MEETAAPWKPSLGENVAAGGEFNPGGLNVVLSLKTLWKHSAWWRQKASSARLKRRTQW